MPDFIELTGHKFSRLTVISRVKKITPSRWYCSCECGKKVIVRTGNLQSGHTKSCGCLSRGIVVKRNTTHGLSKSPEFSVWHGMIQRCKNPNGKYYDSYGGRGIKVCKKWRESFAAFYSDMGERPTQKHSIDRIDNDGNYGPDNCRWATVEQQQRNKRIPKNNTSGHKGVYWHEPRKKWLVYISAGEFIKRIHLGYFSDFDEAVRVRKEAEKTYWE